MRTKSAIYTTKQEAGHPRHFYMGGPPRKILPAVGNDSQTDQTIKTINLFVARDFQSNIYIYVCLTNFFTNLECSTRMIIYIVEIRYLKKKHHGSLMACLFVIMCFPFD